MIDILEKDVTMLELVARVNTTRSHQTLASTCLLTEPTAFVLELTSIPAVATSSGPSDNISARVSAFCAFVNRSLRSVVGELECVSPVRPVPNDDWTVLTLQHACVV